MRRCCATSLGGRSAQIITEMSRNSLGCFVSKTSSRHTTPTFRRSERFASAVPPPSWRMEDLPKDPRDRAAFAFSRLANSEKSWKRFRHMVDFAVNYQSVGGDSIKSITDVGTDHGLLAVGLAMTGCFDKVLGVDVSPSALENGGFQALKKVQDYLKVDANEEGLVIQPDADSTKSVRLAIRISDGLKQVHPSEADAVCIAGMGVYVMGKILQSSLNDVLDLDRIQCRRLILQPTNSRPSHLVQLYDMLQLSGWTLLDENIEYLSKRWYVSSCFVRSDVGAMQHESESLLPTSKLALREDKDLMKAVTRDYWHHHLKWIQREEKDSGGNLRQEDVRWRDWVQQYIRPKQ